MLINCVAYQNGTKLADISVEAISDYVVRPDCFVWVALFDPGDEELELMAEEFGLHELAVEDARKGHQRPKIEEYGSSMFTVLQTVDIDPANPDGDFIVGEVAVFVGRNYVLSVRRKTPQGFQNVRARAEAEPENLARGSGFVLYAIMDTVVDRYFPVLARLEADLERLETEIFRGVPSAYNIEAFYDLKYRLMVLKHAVASLMEATAKLFGGRVPSVCLGRPGVLPRRLRSPPAHQRRDRQSTRDAADRHLRDPRAGQHRRQPGDQAAGRVRRPDHRADTARRHLRHELRSHAGAEVGLGLSAHAGVHAGRSTSVLFFKFRKNNWL